VAIVVKPRLMPRLIVYSRHVFDRYVLRKESWGTAFGATASVRILEPWKLARATLRGAVRYDRGNLLNITAGAEVNDSKVWEELMWVEWTNGYEYPEAGFEKDVSGLLVHGYNEFKITVRGAMGGWAVTVWDVWLDLEYVEEPEAPPEVTPPPPQVPWWEGVVEILRWVTIAAVAIGGVYVAAQLIRPKGRV